MPKQQLYLLDLPNEILVHVLTPFSTELLLPLTLICSKVHNIVLRILHYRLLLAAAAPEYKIILEAYHPSRRYTGPYLFCEYLGTDGLSSQHEGEGSLYHDCEGLAGRLGKLGALYSRFRPEHPGVEGRIPTRSIAGAVPVLTQPSNDNASTTWSQAAGPTTPVYSNAGDGGARRIVFPINLDDGELFGQFCAYASLVRLGPRRGVFLSTVDIVERGQGTIRIWRQWLIDRCTELYEAEQNGMSNEDIALTSTTRCPAFRSDPTILWTDYRKNVGLRVQVRHRNTAAYRMPVLDDESLACNVEIQELIVRTTHLMLAVEDSVAQISSGGGKTLIFGSFAAIAT